MTKEQKSITLKIYLSFTILFYFSNLILASISESMDKLVNFLSPFYLIFCLIALIVFIVGKLDKLTYLVPILNLAFAIFTASIGLFSTEISKIEFGLWWQVVIHLVYIINIVLSVYIIKKLKIKVHG